MQQLLLPYVLALILNDKNEILLGYRKNTEWFPNHYGLIGGSIQDKESATQAMVREMAEEIGIGVDAGAVEFVHVMDFMGITVPCVAFFYRVKRWEGDITNKEVNKHDHLQWFPLDHLPENIIPRHKKAIELIAQEIFYSEDNW